MFVCLSASSLAYGRMTPQCAGVSVRMHMRNRVKLALPAATLLRSHAGCRLVMTALAEQENWPEHRWVYDGQKILYIPGGSGPGSFLPQHENVFEVGLSVSHRFLLPVLTPCWSRMQCLTMQAIHGPCAYQRWAEGCGPYHVGTLL